MGGKRTVVALVGGIVLVVVSLAFFPRALLGLADPKAAGFDGDSGALVAALVLGGLAFVVGVSLFTWAVIARRRAVRADPHHPVTAAGKANEHFDEGPKPLPTGGVPGNWIDLTP